MAGHGKQAWLCVWAGQVQFQGQRQGHCHGLWLGHWHGHVHEHRDGHGQGHGHGHADHYGDEDVGDDNDGNGGADAADININAEYGNITSTTTTMTRRCKQRFYIQIESWWSIQGQGQRYTI